MLRREFDSLTLVNLAPIFLPPVKNMIGTRSMRQLAPSPTHSQSLLDSITTQHFTKLTCTKESSLRREDDACCIPRTTTTNGGRAPVERVRCLPGNFKINEKTILHELLNYPEADGPVAINVESLEHVVGVETGVCNSHEGRPLTNYAKTLAVI